MPEREQDRPTPYGPVVSGDESLFRILTNVNRASGWLDGNGQISSAAFNLRCFSVEIESRTNGPDDSMSRVSGGCAVFSFSCACAQGHGFDIRDERDPDHPENKAHANVYLDRENNERKRAAKRLKELCRPRLEINACT